MKSFEEFKQSLEEKAHTIPKTKKEKDLAALAEPKDKITHADVMKGRGVSEDLENMHYCAKHVYSERFGEGFVVEGSHAEPNADGLIEWYDVDFGGTVRRVMTEKVKVMHAEYHMNHKKKKMAEEGDCEDGEEMEDDKLEEAKSATHSVYNATVRAEKSGDGPGVKHYVTTYCVIVARGDDEEKRVKQAVAKHYGDTKHEVTSIVKGQFNRKKPDLNKGIQEASEYVDEEIKKGDFIKDPMGKLHRVFDVKGTTLHTGEYRGDNSYGGNSTLHITKAKKVAKPAEVNEEVDLVIERLTDDAKSKIQRALGHKLGGNPMRKDSSAARAMIKFAKEHPKNVVQKEEVNPMEGYVAAIAGGADFRDALDEKKLTPAELKKREEIAQAIERENPGMDMGKKMAIATAQAKKVAEEAELDESKLSVGDKLMWAHSKSVGTGGPKELVKRHKEYDTDTLKKLKSGSSDGNSPAALQQRVIKHELKKRGVVEEVEELEELSKNTLGSYIKKASADSRGKSYVTGYATAAGTTAGQALKKAAMEKNKKREAGITKAVDKLTKEDVEQIDEADEREVSDKLKRARDYEKVVNSRHNSRAHTKEIQVGVAKDMLDNAHKAANQTPVAKFLKTRKGDGKVRTEEVEQIDEYEIGQAANGKFYDDEGNEVKRIHRGNRRHVMNYNHSYGQDRPYKPGGHYASREQDKSKQTKNEEVGVSYKDFIDRLNNQE